MLRLLRFAGLFACLLVAAPAFIDGPGGPAAFAPWLGSLVVFAALYAWTTGRLSPAPLVYAALAVQAACVIVMVATQCRGLEGTLLVLVAMELGLVAPRRVGLLWIAAQSPALFWAIQHHWSLRPALLFTPPYLGFQVLAFLVVELLRREAKARADLARANAELVSTRELLAESARLGERLRIARELHDAMGHHLAGLSLNLEALARREAPDPALETARSLTRRLLDDVESVVDALARDRGVDLGRALAALAGEIPRPRIHVAAEGLALPDPERAHVLLRCCQEIVTNAVKHADAANLWITIRVAGGVFELSAHDDGSGASRLDPGLGLAGMRRRFEEMGGALDLETHPGAGFRIHATLPSGATA
jgi:signal transduction histidine kinase